MLLTRSPLEYFPKEAFPLDLHVLSTPPAFVLSQDQTLHWMSKRSRCRSGEPAAGPLTEETATSDSETEPVRRSGIFRLGLCLERLMSRMTGMCMCTGF